MERESGFWEIFAFGIWHVGKFCLWNLESWVLESGIALTIGIQDPSCNDKYWNPVPGIDSMESRIQDCPGFPYLGWLSNKMLARVGIMNYKK